MTPTAPVRRDARSNRAKILVVAQSILADNPDASMDEIAAAAGVVRRTVYGHFDTREALIDGIATQAATHIAEVVAGYAHNDGAADEVFARNMLSLVEVGEQYRLLLTVARRNIGDDGIRALLSSSRSHGADTIRRGQHDGIFADYLSADAFVTLIEAVSISIMESTNVDFGLAAVTAGLALLGVPPERAALLVAAARSNS